MDFADGVVGCESINDREAYNAAYSVILHPTAHGCVPIALLDWVVVARLVSTGMMAGAWDW